MSAPAIPDAIEAACKGPGVWLIQGHAVTRIAPRTWVAEDIPGSFPTLQEAIDRIADGPPPPSCSGCSRPLGPSGQCETCKVVAGGTPGPSCTCGARDLPSCLCKLTPAEWVAAHPDRPVA